jgi:hypothetical protein
MVAPETRTGVSLLLAASLLLISSCASHKIKMIQPQTGATAECGGSGYGAGAGFSEGFVSGCMRAYENRGFVRLDQLTPDQRARLEQRGLLPKDK